MSQHIEIAKHGAVVVATMSRLDKKNALTGEMYNALTNAFRQTSRDETAGALLLRGRDGVFTAGNDIADFIDGIGNGQDFPGWNFIQTLATFDKPLVAAIDGAAIGVGTTLCFHCDLVYAAPQAIFRMPFVDLGLVPEAGSSLLAPQRFGYALAAQYILLAEPFDAPTALRLGLVNEVIEVDALYDRALAKAQALAAKPRDALLAARRLMRGDPAILKARMEEEIQLFREAIATPQARNAFAAFLQRPRN